MNIWQSYCQRQRAAFLPYSCGYHTAQGVRRSIIPVLAEHYAVYIYAWVNRLTSRETKHPSVTVAR